MLDEPNELEVIPSSALEAITRGEIDIQIRTAKQYPRSMKKFLSTAIDQATAHVEIAESFIYVRPVGKKDGKMQYAEGLSVRAAEIVGAAYGNLRVGSMIVEQTDRYVVTRGFAHDLESNFASTSENKEPTVTKEGKPFSEGMRAVIAKASLAKARRDATFQVVPKALCRPIETAARALIAGDAKSLDDRRANAVQFIQRLNIDASRVWAALGVAGEEELTSEILLTLSGIRNAIKDGEVKIDDAFPVPGASSDGTAPKFVPKTDDKKPEPKTEKPKVEPPTPLQKLQRLAKAAEVTDEQIVAFCVAQGEEVVELTDISETSINIIVSQWVDLLPRIKGEAQPAEESADGAGGENVPSSETLPIPQDPAQLIVWLKAECTARDIDEKDVVAAAKKRKWCGAATNFSEMPQPGRVKLSLAINEITKEIGG